MKSIAFFNNKGGVGKTTLACNVAAHLARNQKQRVILVDCDPQCNATQLVLDEDECFHLYWATSDPGTHTLLDVLQGIQDGGADIKTDIIPTADTRFSLDLLPGHPRMSIVEDKLSQAWNEAASGDIGGLRRTSWCAKLTASLADKYDVAIFDVGPSLGSLNRSVLLGCTHFVTPMGCDIFSIVGIRNIAAWLTDWTALYSNSLAICDNRHPGAADKYGIQRTLPLNQGFAGYTVQQYITKSAKGERRATQAFEAILDRIPTEVSSYLGKFAAGNSATATKLGDVPNMYSLIPLAQSAHAPIMDLSAGDGLRGSSYSQAAKYASIIDAVARSLSQSVGLPESNP